MAKHISSGSTPKSSGTSIPFWKQRRTTVRKGTDDQRDPYTIVDSDTEHEPKTPSVKSPSTKSVEIKDEIAKLNRAVRVEAIRRKNSSRDKTR